MENGNNKKEVSRASKARLEWNDHICELMSPSIVFFVKDNFAYNPEKKLPAFSRKNFSVPSNLFTHIFFSEKWSPGYSTDTKNFHRQAITTLKKNFPFIKNKNYSRDFVPSLYNLEMIWGSQFSQSVWRLAHEENPKKTIAASYLQTYLDRNQEYQNTNPMEWAKKYQNQTLPLPSVFQDRLNAVTLETVLGIPQKLFNNPSIWAYQDFMDRYFTEYSLLSLKEQEGEKKKIATLAKLGKNFSESIKKRIESLKRSDETEEANRIQKIYDLLWPDEHVQLVQE